MTLYDSLQNKFESIHIYSGYFSTECIFHNDSNPSMFVYEESDNKNYEFRCASCGKHGSLSYLDKVLGSHTTHALTQSHSRKPTVLPRWRKWENAYGDLEGIAKFAHENLKGHEEFFKRRKIDEFIEKGYFGWIDGWNLLPVFESTGKRIVDIVARAGKHKPGTRYAVSPLVSDGTHTLYCPNWKRVGDATTIYIVYGIVDAWTMESIELPCVTGISGKSLSAELLKPLNKKYIIIPDDGEEREAYNLANKLGWRCSTKILSYPDGTKDCDEIRMKFGNEYLLNMLGA